MNTDRLLDVLTTQLNVLQASITGQDVAEIFDDEGFDVSVVLDTPNAIVEEMEETLDIAQIYLSDLIEGMRRISASSASTPRHRRQALSMLFAHRTEIAKHMAAVEHLEKALRVKQTTGNVLPFRGKM